MFIKKLMKWMENDTNAWAVTWAAIALIILIYLV